MFSPRLQRIFDWLVDGAPGTRTPMDLIAKLAPDMVEAGVPLDRVEAFVRTLHPSIVGRSFLWVPGKAVEVRENSFAYLHSPEFLASPIARVFESGAPVRIDLTNPNALPELAAQGFTDFLAAPFKFVNGEVHGITFATRAPGGFSEQQIAELSHVMRPLTRMAEILALSRTAVNLLNTYVGRNAGERIMAGHIQRGDTDIIRCVIWFSDLRGFTSMADTTPPGDLIRTLNELFDCQVSAIERHGGEVLKYMGDGMLAIFPIVDGERRKACLTALGASSEAFAGLETLNRRRVQSGEAELRFGLALHVGDVAYGNIGGAGRLDFTCIGPAVNLAARIEGLTAKSGRPVLLSDEFVRELGDGAELVGEFELKGLPGKQRVHAPRAQGFGTLKE